MIKIIRVNDWDMDNNYSQIDLETSYTDYNGNIYWHGNKVRVHNSGSIDYNEGSEDFIVYDGRSDIRLNFRVSNGWIDLVLAVTAQFPN